MARLEDNDRTVERVLTEGELEELLRSPRLNERYEKFPGRPSRWRLIQIERVLCYGVMAVGFWLIGRNTDRDTLRDVRAQQVNCETINDGRTAIRDLVDAFLQPVDGNGQPIPATDGEKTRIDRAKSTALQVLPPVRWDGKMCAVQPIDPGTGPDKGGG